MYKKKKHREGMRFYPNFIMDDVFVICLFMIVFCLLVFIFPELILDSSEAPANPFDTPEHIKPEWYFLAAYQFLKIIPSELGAIILQNIALLLFIALPFLDRSRVNDIRKRPIFLAIVILSIFVMTALTVWGKYS